MYQATLFLGLPIDGTLASALAKLDPEMKSLFIDDPEGNYLALAEFEGRRYLGKFPGEIAALTDLDLLQNNVYSLLVKLFPDYPCRSIPLTLTVVPKPQTSGIA